MTFRIANIKDKRTFVYAALVILALLVIAITTWSYLPSTRAGELRYLRTVLPQAMLDKAHLEIASLRNIAIKTEGGQRYLGLGLFPGQNPVDSGMRSEISISNPYKAGQTVRYSWRFMLPKGFISDAPRNRWWSLAQWHDQPADTRGETLQNSPLHRPTIMLLMGESNRQIAATLDYGVDKSQYSGFIRIEPGVWHNVNLLVHWSQHEDGYAVLFFDNAELAAATATGPNMRSEDRHYLNVGMYREPTIATNNWIYIGQIEVVTQ